MSGTFLLLLAATGCKDVVSAPPALLRLSPDSALEGEPVEVTIAGENLAPRVFANYDDHGESRVDATYTARLGGTTLRRVRLNPEGVLSAIVPEGMAPGLYELTLTDPWDRTSVVPDAFHVLSVAELDRLVAGYLIEPVGPQHVFTPFQLQVSAVDAQGAVVKPYSGSTILTDLTGSVVPKAAGDFAFGRWAGRVELRSPHAANVLTVTDAAGRTGSSNEFAVATQVPVALRFATPERTAAAAACSAAVTLQLVDGIGAEAPADAPLPLTLTPSPAAGFTLYRDASCATPLDAPVLDRGTSRYSFHFIGTQAGKVLVEASAPSLQAASQTERVAAAAPAELAFLAPGPSVVAGQCSPEVALETRDAYGNVARLPATSSVGLTALPATGLTFYSDAACASPVSAVDIAAGASQATFHFLGTRAGTVTVKAASAGLSDASQSVAVTPAVADHLAFTSPAQILLVGSCSPVARVETRDAFGNPSGVQAATALSVTSAPAPGLSLFADSSCAAPLANPTVAAAASSATFYFRGSTEGQFTLTASAAGFSSVDQVETIGVPPAARFAFLSAPQTLVAGQCSALTTLESRDLNDAQRPVAAATSVSLQGTTGVTFYSDAACANVISNLSVAAGASQTSFYFRGTQAGVGTLTSSVVGWFDGTQNETFTPAPLDRLAFGTSPRSTFAGDCSAKVTAAIEDPYGNLTPAVAAATVNLSAAPAAGFKFFTDSSCAVQVSSVVIASGASSGDFYFKGTGAAQVTVGLAAPGLLGASQLETVTPQVASQLGFLTPSRSTTAGSCSGVLTVQTQDSFGNPAAVAASGALTLSALPAASLAFYSDGSCTTAASGLAFSAGTDTVSFYFRSSLAGTATVTAAAFTLSQAQQETVAPAAASAFSFDPLASPRPMNAPFAVRLRAQDLYGNLTPSFSGTAVLAALPSGAANCTRACSGPAATNSFTNGIWSGEVAITTPAGAGRRLVATSGSLGGLSNAFDVAAPPAASAPIARLSATPGAVVAGQAIAFTAASSYDYQTPAAGLEASWDLTGAAAGAPPWTPWSSTLSASQVFGAPGLYYPRVAVRDAAGDVGFAVTAVVVVAAPADLCTVTVASEVDDGAVACDGPFGADGQLSLAEAVRLANASAGKTITFAGAMTVTGPAAVSLGQAMSLVGGNGVVLQGHFDVSAPLLLAGVELTGQSAAHLVQAAGSLTLFDVRVRDAPGWVVRGNAAMEHVSMSGCTTDCLTDDGSLSFSVRYSELLDAPGAYGVSVTSCAVAATTLELQSNVFANLKGGVRATCPRVMEIVHDTFELGERGVDYGGGAGQSLRDNLFTHQTLGAAQCGAATFLARDYQSLFANASAGCLAGDPSTLVSDPLYSYPAARDYTLQPASPAVDSAVDLGKDVNGPGPGSFFGAGPDRGGKESR